MNQFSEQKQDLRLVALCAALALTGCVSVPHKPYDKAVNTHVRKIALMPFSSPEELSVTIVNHPGAQFGLIGGLVAAADTANMTQAFTQQQASRQLKLESEIGTALSEALTADGSFELVPAGAPQKHRKEFLKEYPAAQCDAYLDVVINYAGYWAQGATTPYVPTLAVPVRLVDAKSRQVLYTATVFVTDGSVPTGGEQVRPDKTYSFDDFDALKAAPDQANEGLKKGARAVAQQIAKDLTGEPASAGTQVAGATR